MHVMQCIEFESKHMLTLALQYKFQIELVSLCWKQGFAGHCVCALSHHIHVVRHTHKHRLNYGIYPVICGLHLLLSAIRRAELMS